MQAGISTLGVKFAFGAEDVAGTKPSAFDVLHRINAIGGISLATETIDASALEDFVERTVAGRQSTGGTFPVTVNLTNETEQEWANVISEYTALTGGARMWFEVYSPSLTKAFFIVAQPPMQIPMPSFDQNGLLTVEMTLTIDEYVGLDTAIVPTDSENTQ